jgi:hypothetical protein
MKKTEKVGKMLRRRERRNAVGEEMWDIIYNERAFVIAVKERKKI